MPRGHVACDSLWRITDTARLTAVLFSRKASEVKRPLMHTDTIEAGKGLLISQLDDD